MITLKEIFGYDLHVSKLVFEHGQQEIVFIHDFCILKRRIYVDGEQLFNRHSQYFGFTTNAEFSHNGKDYRIVSRTLNFLSMKQDVTLWVDGVEIERKIAPFYAALPLKKKLHAALGLGGAGVLLGVTLSLVFGG